MSIKSIIVIGGGPGGFAAALAAARRGLAVTLVDQNKIGGTCLNRGCIPSKFFLSAAKKNSDAQNLIHSGVELRAAGVSLAKMVDRKESLLGTLRQRMEQALKASKITWTSGAARLISPHQVEILSDDAEFGVRSPEGGSLDKNNQPPHSALRAPHFRMEADAIILATGSEPARPSLFPDHPAIFDSDTIFDLPRLPEHLVVLGGGYIGCELACAFHGLGSKVTLIEKESRLLATQPEFHPAAAVIERSFEKRGMTLMLGTSIDRVETTGERELKIHGSNGQTLEAGALLLSLGRRPNLKGLAPESAGLKVENGRLKINGSMQTSVPSIYAIGDLVSPLPLAHVAAKEADVAVAHLCGETKTIDYSAIPRCVYTWPEAAAVGITEEQALKSGITPRVDRYHFAASSKALVEDEAEGSWIIVSDSQTRRILGGLIIGPHATELIHLIVLSIKAKLTAQDIADTVFAHPSLSEGFGEAMSRSLTINKRPQ
jgi:dihydrolipoamide dehydrogenase